MVLGIIVNDIGIVSKYFNLFNISLIAFLLAWNAIKLDMALNWSIDVVKDALERNVKLTEKLQDAVSTDDEKNMFIYKYFSSDQIIYNPVRVRENKMIAELLEKFGDFEGVDSLSKKVFEEEDCDEDKKQLVWKKIGFFRIDFDEQFVSPFSEMYEKEINRNFVRKLDYNETKALILKKMGNEKK